jgi:uncharacterized protein
MRLPVAAEDLEAFCRKNQIRRLSLFGSVLHGDDRPDSDIDLLVDFEPGAKVGYFDMARMEDELAGMLGRRVDLRTAEELSRYFRAQVLEEAEVQFAQV